MGTMSVQEATIKGVMHCIFLFLIANEYCDFLTSPLMYEIYDENRLINHKHNIIWNNEEIN